jgi:hypothetical protein
MSQTLVLSAGLDSLLNTCERVPSLIPFRLLKYWDLANSHESTRFSREKLCQKPNHES